MGLCEASDSIPAFRGVSVLVPNEMLRRNIHLLNGFSLRVNVVCIDGEGRKDKSRVKSLVSGEDKLIFLNFPNKECHA